MNKVLVLDLDDTLYAELDYLKSAYTFISKKLSIDDSLLYALMLEKYLNSEDVFKFLVDEYNADMQSLLSWYRFHDPDINLYSGVKEFLETYSKSSEIAIITDGRSETQRNKIRVLGLDTICTSIVISEELQSEKPCRDNFEKVMLETVGNEYIYIGDNLKKDFITPKDMGWITICLKDQGQNIHKQDFTLPNQYLPEHCFASWLEIKDFLDTL